MDKIWIVILIILGIMIGISFFKDYQVKKRYNIAKKENIRIKQVMKKDNLQ